MTILIGLAIGVVSVIFMYSVYSQGWNDGFKAGRKRNELDSKWKENKR